MIAATLWCAPLLAVAQAAQEAPPPDPPGEEAPTGTEEPAADPVLDEVRTLARAGAVDLALERLDARQPPAAMDPVAWVRWERERIHLMRLREDWQGIIGRLEDLPDEVGEGFRHQAGVERVDAWLQAGEPARARALARRLIWEGGMPPVRVLTELRGLILRAYQAEGMDAAARVAMQRQRMDSDAEGTDLAALQARLYLAEGRPADAFAAWPETPTEAESVALRRLAGLRAGALAPGTVLERSVAAASGEVPDAVAMAHWSVAAEAAERLGNPVARISALEHSLARSRPRASGQDRLFARDGDDLWDAYLALGLDLGNRLQLILGDDEAWMDAARGRAQAQPVEARAMAAVIALRGRRTSLRDQAHHDLATPLFEQAGGGTILYQLYMNSRRFGTASSVPVPVRYLLVDFVLNLPDIPLASGLMADLATPPAGADPADWLLRRSRVLILGGRVEEGLEPLRSLIRRPGSVDVDRLLQVVFDLQSLERHDAAAEALSGLLAWPLEPGQRREILYWMGDSVTALGDGVEAARLYLRSATLLDPVAMDPWAQTARYRAAERLAEAGYTEDARSLYRGLLRATRDPARQAMLRNELQQLTLIESRD